MSSTVMSSPRPRARSHRYRTWPSTTPDSASDALSGSAAAPATASDQAGGMARWLSWPHMLASPAEYSPMGAAAGRATSTRRRAPMTVTRLRPSIIGGVRPLYQCAQLWVFAVSPST